MPVSKETKMNQGRKNRLSLYLTIVFALVEDSRG